MFFFFNDTATTEIYTLSLHDALPILLDLHLTEGVVRIPRWVGRAAGHGASRGPEVGRLQACAPLPQEPVRPLQVCERSEEHTSELQSRQYLVCRLLLEKKNKHNLHHW